MRPISSRRVVTETTPTRADVMLREALSIMEPLARALVINGVNYPTFALAMKEVFLKAAQAELSDGQKKITDSALSLLSGVHRKDVRALAPQTARRSAPARAFSIASEVARRWLTDPDCGDESGRPKRLPMRNQNGGASSFETLAQAVSKDFHPHSVLQELLRLGVVTCDDETVELKEDGLVAFEGFEQLAYLFGSNLRDHAAASVANLRSHQSGKKAPFLEYSTGAEELTAESATRLQQLANELWRGAFQKLAKAASAYVDHDRGRGAGSGARVRFGAYFFSEEAIPSAGTSAGVDSSNSPAAGVSTHNRISARNRPP